MHMKGFNLTMPHKVRVIPFLDGVTNAARIIGAVNTVYTENGRYIGDNTDGKGFVEAMKMQGAPIEGKKIVLLGAGGAGKAIGRGMRAGGRKAHHRRQPATGSAAKASPASLRTIRPARRHICLGKARRAFPIVIYSSTPPASALRRTWIRSRC